MCVCVCMLVCACLHACKCVHAYVRARVHAHPCAKLRTQGSMANSGGVGAGNVRWGRDPGGGARAPRDAQSPHGRRAWSTHSSATVCGSVTTTPLSSCIIWQMTS